MLAFAVVAVALGMPLLIGLLWSQLEQPNAPTTVEDPAALQERKRTAVLAPLAGLLGTKVPSGHN